MMFRRRSARHARSTRGAVAVVAALALTGAVIGCGGDDTAEPDAEGVDSTSRDGSGDASASSTADSDNSGTPEAGHAGGELTLLAFIDTAGFDPAVAIVNSQFNVQNFALYDALVYEKPTDGSVEYGLLQSAETDDAKNWTLKLKPDLVFSDGTPLNAEAIRFNWKRLADPELASPSAPAARSIDTMKVVDETTLEVALVEPNGQFPRTIATTGMMWVGSPKAIKADPRGFNTTPVGAGPFTLEKWERNSQATFVKNPSYHGDVLLDRFTIRVIPDETQRLNTLQSGGGDAAFTVDPVGAKSYSDAGYASAKSSPNGGFFLFYNVSRPPFDDVRAREALSLAMDPAGLTDAIFDGFVEPEANIFEDNSPFYDEAFDQPAPDDAKAQALLDELAEDNGGPLEFSISYVPPFAAHAEWFQTKLSAFDNVEVSLDEIDYADYQKRYSAGDYEAGIYAFNLLDPDGLSKHLATDAPLNYMQYSDPDIDELLVTGRNALDEAARIDAYREMQQKLSEEFVFVVIHRTNAWLFFDDETVHGITDDDFRSQSGGFSLNQAWVER